MVANIFLYIFCAYCYSPIFVDCNPANQHSSCCTESAPCEEGEGDCDLDYQCAGDLVCGTDNCAGGPSAFDCCESRSFSKSSQIIFKIIGPKCKLNIEDGFNVNRSTLKSEYFDGGSHVTLECNDCHHLIHDSDKSSYTIQCNSDGTWNNSITGCTKNQCMEPAFDQNSVIEEQISSRCGETIFKCRNDGEFLKFQDDQSKINYTCTSR